jgi:hypothetical protein
MLNCSSPPSAGSLEIFGVSVNDNPRLIKSRLGVVPQDNNLDSELTVVENLKIYARYFGIVPLEATRRAAAALDLFQLTDKANAKCDSLSGVMLASMTAAVLSLSSRTSSFSYFVSLGIYPMQLFSGIFFPLSMLPKEFAWVPFLSPIYPAVVIGRNLFNGSPSLMDLVYALWLITLAIVFYIISIILMKKRLIV